MNEKSLLCLIFGRYLSYSPSGWVTRYLPRPKGLGRPHPSETTPFRIITYNSQLFKLSCFLWLQVASVWNVGMCLILVHADWLKPILVLGEAVTHTNIPHASHPAACNHRKHDNLNN